MASMLQEQPENPPGKGGRGRTVKHPLSALLKDYLGAEF